MILDDLRYKPLFCDFPTFFKQRLVAPGVKDLLWSRLPIRTSAAARAEIQVVLLATGRCFARGASDVPGDGDPGRAT